MENKLTYKRAYLKSSLMESHVGHGISLMWRKGHQSLVYNIPHWEKEGYSKPERTGENENKITDKMLNSKAFDKEDPYLWRKAAINGMYYTPKYDLDMDEENPYF